MKIFKILLSIFLLSATYSVYGQNITECGIQVDLLLNAPTSNPFNGVVLISQNGKTVYSKVCGYSDFERKTPLKFNDRFVIGSISKQITAVIVLQEYEKGHLKLYEPIRTYLPELPQSWADTVTIRHLLTHMHGIAGLDKPTAFPVGTQFDYGYSSPGYDLLATIVERTSGKSFPELSMNLFAKCRMKNSFHPDGKKYISLVKGYAVQEDGNRKFETTSFRNPVAAGAFISTAEDLACWNENLFGGKLLKKETFDLMTAKQPGAVRNHPVFGTTEYGLGITVDDRDGIVQWGQTGYADGFVSMDFYFPETKTSVIVLENVVSDENDLKKAFYYHTQILDIVREDLRPLVNFDSPYAALLEKNIISTTDANGIFESKEKASGLYYYALVPKAEIKGALVLLPSTLEETESVLNNNKKLCQLACDNGIAVIVPSTNAHICLDKPVLDFLNQTFADAVKQYKIPSEKFVIGGFSLGGIVSLRYTEMAYEDKTKTTVVPCAAFSVDGPVDFITMYRQFENDVKKNINWGAVAEANYYIQGMHDIFGGSPDAVYQNYVSHSIYTRGESLGGNAQYLRTVPVRVYSDPDIDWAIKERQRDLYDMNAPDHTAMIVELNLQGNDRAEFVNRLRKGYRMDGTRHPHSWSLVDADDCVEWMLRYIK